jgi:glycosyltransferase involved in cell wall biosynthesis
MFKKLSVIIPALNEEKYIGNCISSLYHIERDDLDMEIILVDNGSTDRTFEIAEKLGAKTYIVKDVRIAGLRNYGVRQSTGDILAFVDADCVVGRDWLIQSIKTMDREEADAVGSHHIVPEDSGWIGRTSELLDKRKSAQQQTIFHRETL